MYLRLGNMPEEKNPSYSAKWLVRRLITRGISLNRIFRGTDLSESWLKDENALIPKVHYMTIVNNALDKSKDPALAFRLGRQPSIGEMGIWGYAIISSTTMGEANQVAVQFWELNGGMVRLDYHKENDCSTWKILPAFPMDSARLWIFAVEILLSTFFSGFAFLLNKEFTIEEIRLSYPEPSYSVLYRELFKCPIFFNQEMDMFRLSSQYEKLPTATGNPQLAAICKQQCLELLAKLKGSDELVSAIRHALIASLGQFPRLPKIAGKLAMSPRTLRRRLQERNTTYQNILDEIRIELTKEYITTTSLSIDQIAGRIGFSETTTFRRAFKKWTGLNIGEFRKMKAR
jgi:AraC-like DNA-binding protein